MRDVIDKLVVGLVTLNRETAGVANDRTGNRCRIGKPNNGGIIARRNINQSGAEAQPITKFARRARREKMRPGKTDILLFVILVGAFADDDVIRVETLARVLPAGVEAVLLARVPIKPARIITRRKIEALFTYGSANRARVVWHKASGETCQNRGDKGAVSRRVIGRRLYKPSCRDALTGQEDSSARSPHTL